MQLRFTSRELNLIAVALGYPWDGTLRREVCAKLLKKVLAHDFGLAFDELEDLAEILNDARHCEELREDANEIQAIVDKVTEAMAMA